VGGSQGAKIRSPVPGQHRCYGRHQDPGNHGPVRVPPARPDRCWVGL